MTAPVSAMVECVGFCVVGKSAKTTCGYVSFSVSAVVAMVRGLCVMADGESGMDSVDEEIGQR